MSICGETLAVSGLVLDGTPIDDYVGTYEGLVVLSVDIGIEKDRRFPTMLVHELMERWNEN